MKKFIGLGKKSEIREDASKIETRMMSEPETLKEDTKAKAEVQMKEDEKDLSPRDSDEVTADERKAGTGTSKKSSMKKLGSSITSMLASACGELQDSDVQATAYVAMIEKENPLIKDPRLCNIAVIETSNNRVLQVTYLEGNKGTWFRIQLSEESNVIKAAKIETDGKGVVLTGTFICELFDSNVPGCRDVAAKIIFSKVEASKAEEIKLQINRSVRYYQLTNAPIKNLGNLKRNVDGSLMLFCIDETKKKVYTLRDEWKKKSVADIATSTLKVILESDRETQTELVAFDVGTYATPLAVSHAEIQAVAPSPSPSDLSQAASDVIRLE